jgi:hypothetical protein
MRRIAFLAVVTVVAVALAACTTPHSTASVSAHASPASTALSSRSATPVAALTAPRPALAASCSQLVPASVIDGSFPASLGVMAREDESSAPNDQVEVSLQQAGGLRCVWGGATRTDNGYDNGLQVDVLPNAVSDYNAEADSLVQDPALVDSVGDHSRSVCNGGEQFACSGEVIVNGYWVSVDFHSNDGAATASTSATERLATILSTIVTAVRAAGPPRILWAPPAGFWNGSSLCTPDSDAEARARTAFHQPALASGDFSIEGPFDAATTSFGRVGIVSCGWSASPTPTSGLTDASVFVVPGGAWALAKQLVEHPRDYYFGEKLTVTIAGASSALAACNSTDCEVYASVSGSWLSVDLTGVGDAPTASADVAALLASAPH